jgi:hypothetical protein
MRRLACRGMEIKRTLYIVSQCSPECSLGKNEPQRFTAAQSRMQAGPPPRPSQIKIVCLPAYNLYTTQPVAMGARGGSMFSEGPRPTRKRFFDTQPSSDEENQDDEMPSWGAILTPNSRRSSNGRQPIQLPPPKMTFKLMMMPTPHLASNSRRRI